MQEDTERVEVKDFGFHNLRRLRVFPSSESAHTEIFNGLTPYRLLAVSNAYGLIFAAWPNQGLKVVPTSEVHRFLDDTARDRDSEVSNFKQLSIDLAGGSTAPIVRLHCNCDGTVLAVCYDQPTPIAHIYDVRALSPEYPGPKPIAPFCRIRLDDIDGSSISDFEWNPTSPEVFAACCSSGTATVILVNLNQINTFTVQGPIKATPDSVATCVSWSPKGKQLAIGFENGTVCQYKPQSLQQMKKWAPPSQAVALALNRLVDICWLSTNQFALVSTGGRPEGDQLSLIHLNLPKEAGGAGGPSHQTYTTYDDVCYGVTSERRWAPPRYMMQHVQEWAVLLCSSTTAMETAVLGWKPDTKKWHVWDLDDVSRCQLPLTAIKSDDSYPSGVDIDRTPEAPVVLKGPDGEVIKTLPPAPILLILSTDGALCPFRMIHKASDAVLCQPARKIQNWSDVKIGTAMPSHPAPAATQPRPLPFGPGSTAAPSKPALAPTPAAAPTSSTGDMSVSFTMPLPQPRKQPIPAVAQAPVAPAMGQPIGFQVKPQAPASVVPGQQQPTVPPVQPEAIRAQPVETPEEKAEREKNRLLRMEVIKWAVDFEKQLAGVKSKLAQPLALPGNRDRLVEQIRKLQEIETQVETLTDKIGEEKSQADQLRASICGHLLRADQTSLMAERRRSKEFRTLLRYRPLSSKQENDLKSIRKRYRETRETVDELTTRVERLQFEKKPWQRPSANSPAMGKGERKNSLDMIYRTLANMQAIVMQQRQRLDTTRRERSQLAKGTRDRERRRNRYGLDETDQLSDTLMDTQLTDESSESFLEDLIKRPSELAMNKTPYRMNDSLRRLLEKRDSTPRRTTVPVLKPPTFTYMKKTLAESAATKKPEPAQQRQSQPPVPPTVSTAAFTTSTPINFSRKPALNMGQLAQPPQHSKPTAKPFAAPPPAPILMKELQKAPAAPSFAAPIPAKGLEKTSTVPSMTAPGSTRPLAPPAPIPTAPSASVFGTGTPISFFNARSPTNMGQPLQPPKPAPTFGVAPSSAPAPILAKEPQKTSAVPSFGAPGSIQAPAPVPAPPVPAPAPVAFAPPVPPPAAPAPAPAVPAPTIPAPAAPVPSTVAPAVSAPAISAPAIPAPAPVAVAPAVPAPAAPAPAAPVPVAVASAVPAPAPAPTAPAPVIPAPAIPVPAVSAPVAVAPTVSAPSATAQPAPAVSPAPAVPVTAAPAAPASTVPAAPAPQAAPETVPEDEMAAAGEMEAEAVPTTTAPAPATSPASGFSFLSPAATPQAPAPAAAAAPSTGGIFGGGGGGGFFSGLGGQPNPEAAKKNVFAGGGGFGLGSPLASKAPNEQVKNLFGGGSAQKTETGSSPGFGIFGGGATTGGTAAPSVAQTGFGGFGSGSPPSGGTGGFGTSAAFGAKPAFGGSVFGGSASFGGGATTGSPGGSVFGGTPAFGQAASPTPSGSGFGSFGGGGGGSGFAAFAQKPMPTFGALASNTSPATPAQPSSPFGGGAPATGGFGIGTGSSFSGFGSLSPFQQQPQQQQQQQQQVSFFGGQPQQSPQQQSSFSQWR